MQRLEFLQGKNINYKGVNLNVKNFKKVSGAIVMFTDKRTYNFFPSEIEQFLNDIQIMENTLNTPNTPNTLLSNEDKIKQILFDTLSKVKNDKDYIPQANAICNVVSQLINVKKIEIQLSKK